MNEKKFLALLGLAQKAGKVVSGEAAVQNAVKTGKAGLIIIATDASQNTKKMYNDMSAYYNIAIYSGLSKEQMGAAIGKIHRVALAVTDAGFGKLLAQALDNARGE
jgi:ribosomal protein L7Ae-like RNA K-turn-binding protein